MKQLDLSYQPKNKRMFCLTKWRYALALVGMFLFFNFGAQAQCNADFSYTVIGQQVQFNDLSDPGAGYTIVQWVWDFGNGGTSTQPNPLTMYSSFGDYLVTLNITSDNAGITCTDSKTYMVSVYDVPAVDFYFSSPCLNVPVQFSVDESVTDIGAVVLFNWDFGDGGISNNQNPTHVYSNSGTYQVTLTIVDTLGLSNSVSHEVELYPLPTANFEFSQACLGATTQFTDYSVAASGFITTWEWDFGDGTTQTVNSPDDPDVEHIYANTGTFSVTLSVTTSDGCQNSALEQVQISESPVAEFNWEDACYGMPIPFYDLTASVLDIESWFWDFGDTASGSSNTSVLQNPSHVFSGIGDYTVILVVTNVVGCADTISHDLTVDELPDVSMMISNDHPEINESMQFMGVSSSNISTWFWDFGDGGYALTQNPEYIYSSYGQYIVSLSVIDLAGCESETSQMINVYPPPFFPDSNAIWNTIGENNILNQNWHFRYGLIGDTLMRATKDTTYTYHKVFSLYDSTLTNPNSTYFGAIRSTPDKKVYVKLPDLPESLLYDFALEVGDTAWFTLGGEMCEELPSFREELHYKVVTAIDSVLLLNYQYRRRWHFAGGTMADTWIEGFGSIKWFGLFNPIISTYTYCGDSYSFACFKEDDMALYIDQPDCETCFCDMLTTVEHPALIDTHLSIYPNPAKGMVHVSLQNQEVQNAQLRVFDVHGQLVFKSVYGSNHTTTIDTKNWKSGLYIVLVRGTQGFLKKGTFVVE